MRPSWDGAEEVIFRPVPRSPTTPLRRAEPVVLGLALGALAHLPIARWLGFPVGVDSVGPLLMRWVLGTAIGVGTGLCLGVLLGPQTRGGQAVERWWTAVCAAASAARVRWALLVAVAATAGYAGLAVTIFSGRPLLIDEVVQLLQTRIFEEGHLTRPVDAEPAFRSLMHVVDVAGKYFGQFPPGWSLLMLPFDLARVSWLAGPVLGGVAVLAYAAWLRMAERSDPTRVAALLLFALAPFTAFLAASHMNHVPALALCLVGAAATIRAVAGETPVPQRDRSLQSRVGYAWLAGAAFGAAATIRPVDAFAWCAPAGLWLLAASWPAWRGADGASRGARWLPLHFAAAAAIPAAALLWYNAQTTGSPLLFAYEQLWGPLHRLGFHDAPWGPPHTPARGLFNTHVSFLRLQTYGFEGLLPAVSMATGALIVWPRFSAADRYLAATAVLTTFFYFIYWHDGFFLGPRFAMGVWPFVVMWVARLPGAASVAFSWAPRASRIAAWSLVASCALGWPMQLPFRMTQYRQGLLTMRWDPEVEAARAGATGGLVFVREPWGARTIARLWSLGAPRVETEKLYRHTDLCRIELTVDSLARTGLRGTALTTAMWPLLADSSKLIRAPFSNDNSQKFDPSLAYPERCRRAVLEDAAGTTLLAPRLLARDGTTYVRSLGALDTLLLASQPNREAWLLTADPLVGARPTYVRLKRDSVWAVARGSE